jgi:hypothetical protein
VLHGVHDDVLEASTAQQGLEITGLIEWSPPERRL